MSRHLSDFYVTPARTLEVLLDRVPVPPGAILDPCAGDGALLRVLRTAYPDRLLEAVEIREEERRALVRIADLVTIADVLTWEPSRAYGTIITNPPFSLAQPMIERIETFAARMATPPMIVLLLRLGFLASQKRRDWWQSRLPSALYVLSERPSFTANGHTDSQEYAWYVWNGPEVGHFVL